MKTAVSIPDDLFRRADELATDLRCSRSQLYTNALKATPEAQVGQHKQLFVQFNLIKDGEPMVNSFAGGGILRVDKASVAKIEEPKK